MENEEIRDMKVIDLLTNLLGEKRANEIIDEVQKEIKNGLRGQNLIDFIQKIAEREIESTNTAMCILRGTVPTHNPSDPDNGI